VDPITPEPIEPVGRPVMIHRWEMLTFIHHPVEPQAVQRLLPDGLEVDTFEERAWVGLVPFAMKIRVPPMPFVPWLSVFPETNVRTYVRGRDGRRGIWFFSLDVPRLGAVAAARGTYRLPYCWARMRLQRAGSEVSYRSARRWPAGAARTAIVVEVGEALAPGEVTELEHFLTARWGLYTRLRGGIAYAPVEHPRWPLRRARPTDLRETMIAAAGLPSMTGDPLVHFSPGVEVRIGRPRPVGDVGLSRPRPGSR
jgi:uncharacterized protein YqjF (DUF2071 family)